MVLAVNLHPYTAAKRAEDAKSGYRSDQERHMLQAEFDRRHFSAKVGKATPDEGKEREGASPGVGDVVGPR